MLQHPAGSVEVPRGGGPQASQLPDGLAHRTGVLGQTLDVLKGHVDDLVAAGAAVEVSTREALEAHLVGDAALTVRHVRPQRQGTRQRAALQAAGVAGAELSGRPGRGGGRREQLATQVQIQFNKWIPQGCVLRPIHIPPF